MLLTDAARRVLNWLRAGYPSGVPQHDYVALLGVLKRQLTDDEVLAIARELATDQNPEGSGVTEHGIREAVQALLLQEPTEEDVHRVSSTLARGGWPLAHLGGDETTQES